MVPRPGPLLQGNCFPIAAFQLSWYTWYPPTIAPMLNVSVTISAGQLVSTYHNNLTIWTGVSLHTTSIIACSGCIRMGVANHHPNYFRKICKGQSVNILPLNNLVLYRRRISNVKKCWLTSLARAVGAGTAGATWCKSWDQCICRVVHPCYGHLACTISAIKLR